MRQLKALIVVVIIFFLQACTSADAYDIDNQAIHLKNYEGKWIIITYWATWCKNCLVEIKELNSLYIENELREEVQDFQDPKNSIIVLSYNIDNLSVDELKEIGRAQNIQYPILQTDPLLKLGLAQPEVLPFTRIINPQGKLHRSIIGILHTKDIKQMIKAYSVAMHPS